MPNHILNVVTVIGEVEEVKRMRTAIKGYGKAKDFNEKEEKFYELIIDFSKIVFCPPNIFQGGLSQDDEKKYGKENCWYHWNIENWGTKWSAYDSHNISDTEFSFQTAWSHPQPIFVALSEYFPKLVFDVKYADEDYGSNCDHLTYQKGKTKRAANFEDCSDESGKFAEGLWGGDYD